MSDVDAAMLIGCFWGIAIGTIMERTGVWEWLYKKKYGIPDPIPLDICGDSPSENVRCWYQRHHKGQHYGMDSETEQTGRWENMNIWWRYFGKKPLFYLTGKELD